MENSINTYIGIDISKHKFDVAYFEDNCKKAIKRHYEYSEAGMQLFLSEMPLEGHFVMEFTGVYHLKLLLFLQEQSRLVSMVTGEQVRYFAKMGNNMGKTDGQDAVLICRYAMAHEPKIFKLLEEQELYLKEPV
jgi:transposase